PDKDTEKKEKLNASKKADHSGRSTPREEEDIAEQSKPRSRAISLSASIPGLAGPAAQDTTSTGGVASDVRTCHEDHSEQEPATITLPLGTGNASSSGPRALGTPSVMSSDGTPRAKNEEYFSQLQNELNFALS
ncbi:unnamed protein product, partial [Amoebophrya sp. A25]